MTEAAPRRTLYSGMYNIAVGLIFYADEEYDVFFLFCVEGSGDVVHTTDISATFAIVCRRNDACGVCTFLNSVIGWSDPLETKKLSVLGSLCTASETRKASASS